MANNGNLQPFKKGYDPRRNMRGVPKDAIEARKFFRKIGAELLTIKEKDANGEAVEYDITRLEAAVRLKFGSRAPKDFETILKAMFPGLLKEEVDIKTPDGLKVIIEYADSKNNPTSPPQGTDENQE
jgi:hypothetical protein